MTTIDTLTNAQIRALSTEAGEAGDLEQVAICDRALDGDTAARTAVVKALNYAEAQE